MIDIKQEQYKHLENICNIQQKYINNEINGKEMFEDLDCENLRYLNLLKKQNEELKTQISLNNASNIIMFPKGEKE